MSAALLSYSYHYLTQYLMMSQYTIFMTFLLAVVLSGIIFAYFATQNTLSTTIHFAGNAWGGVPVYLIVLGALLLGFFISWIVSGIDNLFSLFALHGKDSKLRKQDRTVSDLQKKIQDLEIENTRLRDNRHNHNGIFDDRPSLAHTLRHKFSV